MGGVESKTKKEKSDGHTATTMDIGSRRKTKQPVRQTKKKMEGEEMKENEGDENILGRDLPRATVTNMEKLLTR